MADEKKMVKVRLLEGFPSQYLPGFGGCEGGGTIEVPEEIAEQLCTAEHWSREGTPTPPRFQRSAADDERPEEVT